MKSSRANSRSPSASVVVKVRSGTLSKRQVTSIQRIVASSVPKMEINDVSIVDSKGALLTREYVSDENMQFANNEEIRRGYEMRLTNAVTDLLRAHYRHRQSPHRSQRRYGLLSQTVTNRELYNPEAQVLRSATTSRKTTSPMRKR